MPDFTQETGDVAIRFHRDSEWFVARTDGDIHVVRVHANSERVVELFHRLSADLDPLVDVFVDDARLECGWNGMLRALTDVRESLGRLRWSLAAFGGVELTLVTPDNQLTLTTSVSLVIYSRADEWRARLALEGFVERESSPPPVWMPTSPVLSAAPELEATLATFVERLSLERYP